MSSSGKFAKRSTNEPEIMDDLSVCGDELFQSLRWLTYVNKWLGGYEASLHEIRKLFRKQSELTILDVGTGIADYPIELVRMADEMGATVRVHALDANEHAIQYAKSHLNERLPPYLRENITLDVVDATDLPYETDGFDVVHAALFLHHFNEYEAVALLREFQRVARTAVIVNDLHRHAFAYYGVKLLGAVTGAPRMFKHDGPLSVRRGFTREELANLAEQAGLISHNISWRWAFRWVLSSYNSGRSYA